MSHWIYHGEAFDPAPDEVMESDDIGFIYKISHIVSLKAYIGKKLFKSRIKLKPLKGKKRARYQIKESDWRTYTSSCRELNELIESDGKHNFKFEILDFAASKFMLAYKEAKQQFDRDVLFDDRYFNGIINCRLQSVNLNKDKIK